MSQPIRKRPADSLEFLLELAESVETPRRWAPLSLKTGCKNGTL
jgi:hypothetical protein